MTAKQTAFVERYIETGNAAEAARRAGYSAQTALHIGSENLRKPEIRAAIDARMKELAGQRIAGAREVLEYLTSVMRDELNEDTVVTANAGGSASEARVIARRVSARERVRAAELLAKRYGLFVDRVSITDDRPVIMDDLGEPGND